MDALLVAVGDEETARGLSGTAAEVVVWQPGDAPLGRPIDLLVPGYRATPQLRGQLLEAGVRVVQGQSLGYDHVLDLVPEGVVWCNAVGVHEGATAELAVALVLASRRGVDAFVRAQADGRWTQNDTVHPGLQESRVLLVGAGGVNEQVRRRLAPFECEIVRLARTDREDEHGRILAMGEHLTPELGRAEVVVIGVPLADDTTHLVDEAFLAAMRPGALLVNVSRGAIADTDALLRHARDGRIRVALDVTDPEPLPPDHPLWRTPGVIVSPHVGGLVPTREGRLVRLVRDQIERLARGEAPAHIVIGSWPTAG